MSTEPRIDLTMTQDAAMLSDLFDGLPHGVAVTDHSGRVLFVNGPWRDNLDSGLDCLSGLSEGSVLGQISDTIGRPLTATEDYLLEGISRVREGKSGRFDIHYRQPTPDGDRWFLFSANRVQHDNVVLCRVETTAHDLGQEALVDMALHDPLTGLPNRTLVMDRIEMALGRTARSGHWTAVMFADLDGFKDINDELGHGAGDDALIEVAHRLTRVVRGADTCGRWGGDEFVMVVEVGDADAVADVAQRVLAIIEPPMRVRSSQAGPADGDGEGLVDREISLRVSLGVALARSRFPVDELLRLADEAMYKAKRRGGGIQLVTAGRQG